MATTVDRITRLVCRGGDINPYQSRGLTGNDVSGKQRAQRTDLLWADWGIRHFHLTDQAIAPGQYYSERSDWLLFALVFKDTVFCIDVRRHPTGAGFADDELLAIAIHNWPAVFERYRLKEVLGIKREPGYTQNDTHALRKSGVTTAVEVDGAVYAPPGGGITSAATSTRVSLRANQIRHAVTGLADQFADEQGAAAGRCRDAGILHPQFQLSVTPRGLAVYEQSLDTAWLVTVGGDAPAWAETLAPQWAIARLPCGSFQRLKVAAP